MVFSLSFYIFSLLVSYLDCRFYRIPNISLLALLLFLISFGVLESELSIYSIIISFTILLFFVILLLIMPKMILGGGDIKYMMLIAVYLNPFLFPLFLLLTGIIQLVFLIFFQKFKKRRVAPMAPAMFLAVVLSQILDSIGLYMG